MAKTKDENYIVILPNGETLYDFSSLAAAKIAVKKAIEDVAKSGCHLDDCVATIYKQVSIAFLEVKYEDQ